jgi:glutamyl-tRNA synthetase
MDYDELGFLPEALSNYLLRLGWGYGDTEIIGRDDATRLFSLGGVGRSPSRFDMKKLENLNGHYIREASDDRLAGLVAPRIGRLLSVDLSEPQVLLLARAMPEMKKRSKDLNELAEGGTFLFKSRPLDMDEKAASLLQGPAADLLALVHAALLALAEWTAEGAEAAVRGVSEQAGVKLGQVAQPLRAALTGRATSPGIFDVLVLLGKDESLSRIADRMSKGEQ